MGNHNAFQTGFPGAKQESGIDGLSDARIGYKINKKEVHYKYNNTKWSATPKANSRLVYSAFTEVHFLKADSSRVEPPANNLKGLRKLSADAELKKFLNHVFDTDKFNNLKKITLPGRNTSAHLIETSTPGTKGKSHYYSEKSFSLGELCVMRLAQKLLLAKQGALYIIDEFEMALHPAAQIRLFEKIEETTKQSNCTILVSTHSSSLIKNAKKSNLIHLENEDGLVTAHTNIFPTYALQHITLDEENSPDRLILVEDISAKSCVDALWREYISKQNHHSLPTISTTIIGGYKEVLRFLERSPSMLPKHTKAVAILDEDAKSACLPTPPTPAQPNPVPNTTQALFKRLEKNTYFLPWTPEVGLCQKLETDLSKHLKGIQTFTGATGLKIPKSLATQHKGLTGKPLREKCKSTIDSISKSISQLTSNSIEKAREDLMSYLIKSHIADDPNEMNKIMGICFK